LINTQSFTRVLCLLLIGIYWSPIKASAQSLPQTAAFVVSGGMIDPTDMRVINQDSVQLPSYVVGLLAAMPPMAVTVVDRSSCTVRYRQVPTDERRYIAFYFSKFIVGETKQQVARGSGLQSMYTLLYIGEEPIYCAFENGRKSCGRTFDSAVNETNLSRVHRVLSHLYSQHCTSAKRRSAFEPIAIDQLTILQGCASSSDATKPPACISGDIQ
jgi:hypothetical protein